MPLACYIHTDFNHNSICGLTKAEWKGGTNNWDWVTCPDCLERRPTQDAPDGAKAAATLSGLYNCGLCGQEKCTQPGFCDDCLAEPKKSEIKSWGDDTAPLVI